MLIHYCYIFTKTLFNLLHLLIYQASFPDNKYISVFSWFIAMHVYRMSGSSVTLSVLAALVGCYLLSLGQTKLQQASRASHVGSPFKTSLGETAGKEPTHTGRQEAAFWKKVENQISRWLNTNKHKIKYQLLQFYISGTHHLPEKCLQMYHCLHSKELVIHQAPPKHPWIQLRNVCLIRRFQEWISPFTHAMQHIKLAGGSSQIPNPTGANAGLPAALLHIWLTEQQSLWISESH